MIRRRDLAPREDAPLPVDKVAAMPFVVIWPSIWPFGQALDCRRLHRVGRRLA